MGYYLSGSRLVINWGTDGSCGYRTVVYGEILFMLASNVKGNGDWYGAEGLK